MTQEIITGLSIKVKYFAGTIDSICFIKKFIASNGEKMTYEQWLQKLSKLPVNTRHTRIKSFMQDVKSIAGDLFIRIDNKGIVDGNKEDFYLLMGRFGLAVTEMEDAMYLYQTSSTEEPATKFNVTLQQLLELGYPIQLRGNDIVILGAKGEIK